MDVRDELIEVRGAPGKLLALLALGVLMTAASLWVGLNAAPGSSDQGYGWAGAAFFGAATVVIALRWRRADRVVLRLDRDGFLDHRLSRHPVPWSDIFAVGTWQRHGQKVMILLVPPETEAAVDLTRTARMTRGMNAALRADGLAVSAAGLAISHDTLRAAVIARIEAAQKKD